MIRLLPRFGGRRHREPLALPIGVISAELLSLEEAQEVVDAATAILGGLRVLFVLADQGNLGARLALRQWREVLDRLARV